MIKKLIVLTIIGLILFSSAKAGLSKFEINSEYKAHGKKISDIKDNINLTLELALMIGRAPSVSAGIIKNNSIVWYGGYGHYNKHYPIRNRQKPNIDTIYCCGSISKSFATTAILQLYEQGKFDLDDNINDYLDFEVKNPYYRNVNITFRMLLSHQSSIIEDREHSRHFLVLLYLLKKSEYPYPIIKKIFETNGSFLGFPIWGDYAPGERSNYSNIAFILIEHLIEVLSNQSFREYCKENILEPLGMHNSSFTIKDLNKSQVAIPTTERLGLYISYPVVDGPNAPGGLRSSVNDLSKYLIAHMNNGTYNGARILNNSTIEMMHTQQYPGSGRTYGLGWLIWDDVLGQKLEGYTGGVPGTIGFMFYNRTTEKGMILFVNRLFSTRLSSISIKYFDVVFNHVFDKFTNL